MSMDNDNGYDDIEDEDLEEVEVEDIPSSSGSNKSIKENIDNAKKRVQKIRDSGNEKVNKAIDAAKNSKAGQTVQAANDKINSAKDKMADLEKKLAESAKNTRAGKTISATNDKVNAVKSKAYDAGNKAIEAAKNTKVGQGVQAASNAIGAAQDKVVKGATKAAGQVAGKAAAKAGAATAAKAAAAAVPYVNLALLALEAAKALKNAVNKVRSRLTGKSEEELKEEKKKKRRLIILIVGIILFIVLSQFAESETVVTDIDDLITRRENRYGNSSELALQREDGQTYKPLLLFSNAEYQEMVYTDYTDDMCYVTMLKELYAGDVNSVLLANPSDFADGNQSEENRYQVSGKNAKKYFMAEMSNFNKVEWYRFTNENAYNYLNSVQDFTSEADMAARDIKPILTREGDVVDDIQLQKFSTSEINVPNLTTYDILPGASEVDKGMVYVDMLGKYMQKWVIPFSILIDTEGDQRFCDNVVNDMYHLARVYMYNLYKNDKTTKRYYYLVVDQVYEWDIYRKDTCSETGSTSEGKYGDTHTKKLITTTNSKDHKPDTEENKSESDLNTVLKKDFITVPANLSDEEKQKYIKSALKTLKSLPDDGSSVRHQGEPNQHTHYYSYSVKNVKVKYVLKKEPVVVARDSSNQPMIQTINVTRNISSYKYIPKLKYLEELYNIFNANYKILPIDETQQPFFTNGANTTNVVLNDESNGIGLVTLQETWREDFQILDSSVNQYKVSYYDEEDYEKIGRRVSRIEWKQDWGPLLTSEISASSDEKSNIDVADDNIEDKSAFDRSSYIASSDSIYSKRVSNIIDFNRSGHDLASRAMTAQKQAMLDWITPYALMVQKEYGILASITIAQKITESGWDWTDSRIETEAHNYFGMKAGSSWTGPVYESKTKEDDGTGSLYTITARFRSYANDEEGFRGRGEFFWRNSKRYGKFINACISGDYQEAINRLGESGYATDISYAIKLSDRIRENNLQEIDKTPGYQFNGTPPPMTGPSGGSSSGGSIPGGSGSSGGGSSSGGSTGSGGVVNPGGGNAIDVPITNENFSRRFEMYPEKTMEECIKAFLKYGDGKGYSYDDLYFAFYHMSKYYSEELDIANTGGELSMSSSGFVWPAEITSSNPDTAIINALYGYTPLYGESHTGIDISRGKVLYREGGVSKGAKVVAAQDGKVTHASSNPSSDSDGYTYVEIESSDGNYITQYGHLSEINVSVGQTVTKGSVIGVMGTTGNSTGVHLHFEVFEKSATGRTRVDPLNFYTVSPPYGTIDRNSITTLPTGYKYVGGASGGGSDVPGGVTSGMPSEAAEALFNQAKESWPDGLDERRVSLMTHGASLVQVVPYVWGGGHGDFNNQLENPTGLDCSGFTSWCYAKAGMSFGSLTSQAFKSNSNFKHISSSELIPGDLGVNGHHVGIYIGKDSAGRNLWLHAESTKTGIVINNYKGFDTFVRNVRFE